MARKIYTNMLFISAKNFFSKKIRQMNAVLCKIHSANPVKTLQFNGMGWAGRASGAQWSEWFNIVQKIWIGNFGFWKLLWVQIVANIRPHKNSYHFDTFDHNYWNYFLELCKIGLKHHIWQFYVLSEQFQKKSFLLGKGLPELQNHNLEHLQIAQGVLIMYFIR